MAHNHFDGCELCVPLAELELAQELAEMNDSGVFDDFDDDELSVLTDEIAESYTDDPAYAA